MAKIEFNIPRKATPTARTRIKIETATGTVANFKVGETVVKFVLQHGPCGKPDTLVHFASGFVFGRLNGPKLSHYLARGSYATPLTDRGAAETLIAQAVAKLGAAGVLEKLSSVPVINP